MDVISHALKLEDHCGEYQSENAQHHEKNLDATASLDKQNEEIPHEFPDIAEEICPLLDDGISKYNSTISINLHNLP